MDNPSENYWEASAHFLWGFRDLKKLTQEVATNPDKVDPSIYAKRLAVFSSGSGMTVEHVADDAALSALKKRYGDPVALINGDYESKNGEAFTFTGGAALLSPSVTATWGSRQTARMVRWGSPSQKRVLHLTLTRPKTPPSSM